MSTRPNSESPQLSELLRAVMRAAQEGTHVYQPGRLENYDPATQRGDVKPLVQRRVRFAGGEETVESLPVIPGVQVVFPRAGDAFFSLPYKRGDVVGLTVADRSLDAYEASQTGQEVDPQDFRAHDLSDAVAGPGPRPSGDPISQADPDNIVVGWDKGGAQIHIRPDGTVEIKLGGAAAVNFSAALAEKLEALWGQFKSAYDIHTHATGTGPSGPPISPAPAWDPAIASGKLRLED